MTTNKHILTFVAGMATALGALNAAGEHAATLGYLSGVATAGAAFLAQRARSHTKAPKAPKTEAPQNDPQAEIQSALQNLGVPARRAAAAARNVMCDARALNFDTRFRSALQLVKVTRA